MFRSLRLARPCRAPLIHRTFATTPREVPPASFAVTSILFQDQTNLFIWAAGFAADAIRVEAESRAGKTLFTGSDWVEARKRAAEAFKSYSEERKQVGVRVHDAINKLVELKKEGKEVAFDVETLKTGNAMDKEVVECAKALQKWLTTASLEVIEAEFDVKSVKNRFHGRADLIARDTKTKELYIVDFKVKPKELNFDVAMQLAAYALAYNEMRGVDPSSPDFCRLGLVVQVKYENGEATVVEKRVKDMESAEVGFHCRNLSFRLERNPANRYSFSDKWLFE